MATKYNKVLIELLTTLGIAVPDTIRADQQMAVDLFEKMKVSIAALVAADATGDAVVTDVLAGKTFSNDGNIGLTGTLTLEMLTSDADAVAADIAIGKTAYVNGILVEGTFDFAVATAGDAVAEDIALNKTAWVDGLLVTGTVV